MFSAVSTHRTSLKTGLMGVLLIAPFLAFADEQPKQQAMPVVTQAVSQQDVPVFSEYSARAKAAQQIDVHARVEGVLEKMSFSEGQPVKAGQILFKIDDRKYRAVVLKAQAQVNVAQANLNQAEREYKRVSGLLKNKAVSAQEADTALSSLELAQANLLGQKAELNQAQIDLDYTEVRAEIAGIAGIKQQDIGNLVGSSASNTLLTNLTQLDKIQILFSIPDADIIKQNALVRAGKLERMQQADWGAELIDSNNTILAKGYIDFVDSRINPATGSVQARAVFDNKNSVILPGEFVRLKITNAIRKNVFTIPQKAVLQMGPQAFVYKAVDGVANLVPVQLGGEQDGNWLVESGLNDGDLVIINDLIKLRPKTPVSVLPAQTEQSKTQETTP